MIVQSVGLVAVGALSGSGIDSLLHTVLAEDVTAGFQQGVLHVEFADGAYNKRLKCG